MLAVTSLEIANILSISSLSDIMEITARPHPYLEVNRPGPENRQPFGVALRMP